MFFPENLQINKALHSPFIYLKSNYISHRTFSGYVSISYDSSESPIIKMMIPNVHSYFDFKLATGFTCFLPNNGDIFKICTYVVVIVG